MNTYCFNKLKILSTANNGKYPYYNITLFFSVQQFGITIKMYFLFLFFFSKLRKHLCKHTSMHENIDLHKMLKYNFEQYDYAGKYVK
jgi:hypothetical protein